MQGKVVIKKKKVRTKYRIGPGAVTLRFKYCGVVFNFPSRPLPTQLKSVSENRNPRRVFAPPEIKCVKCEAIEWGKKADFQIQKRAAVANSARN
ncbi:hypothetical protein CEXT_653741 [Caerostris extrusa]|uniref:Uncharacterized protein n=1 Tax=Caerostris extrusa TaxID=172846 RepID=A0AAV4NFX8_CAEEX|nr:hypothetical protein CEXT_653741 [Caerostris extrusa]